MPTTEEVTRWRGQNLVDSNGSKIGTVQDVYLDTETDRPEWLAVTTGLFGTKVSFVPMAEAAPGDGELRVPIVAAPVDSGVKVTIYARDVSIALSRPMDVSITNRLPGTIVAIEPLALPYVRVTLTLLYALVTTESVERLGLELGLRARHRERRG